MFIWRYDCSYSDVYLIKISQDLTEKDKWLINKWLHVIFFWVSLNWVIKYDIVTHPDVHPSMPSCMSTLLFQGLCGNIETWGVSYCEVCFILIWVRCTKDLQHFYVFRRTALVNYHWGKWQGESYRIYASHITKTSRLRHHWDAYWRFSCPLGAWKRQFAVKDQYMDRRAFS